MGGIEPPTSTLSRALYPELHRPIFVSRPFRCQIIIAYLGRFLLVLLLRPPCGGRPLLIVGISKEGLSYREHGLPCRSSPHQHHPSGLTVYAAEFPDLSRYSSLSGRYGTRTHKPNIGLRLSGALHYHSANLPDYPFRGRASLGPRHCSLQSAVVVWFDLAEG